MTYFYLICLKGAVGVVIHEIGHAIGFFHEQSRPDRDNYVTIHYENIVKEMEFNFKKHSEKELTTNNIPYETASIMHYGSHVSAKQTKTITTTKTLKKKKHLKMEVFVLAKGSQFQTVTIGAHTSPFSHTSLM